MTLEERVDDLEYQLRHTTVCSQYIIATFAIFLEQRGFQRNQLALIFREFGNTLDAELPEQARARELLEEYAQAAEDGPDWTPTIIQGGKK